MLYTIPTGAKRDYGIVKLQDGDPLPDAAVSEGWVKLREDAGRKDESEESKALLDLLELREAKARSDSKGVWVTEDGRIENSYEVSDPKEFAEKWKGKSLDAVVERVLSGDRMVVRLILSPTKHVQTIILVAGIRAPATKRTNSSDGKEQPAEPFGPEAHQFVESRMLQRSVTVEVVGSSPQGQLICVVKHPNGSIANFVLEAGLARCTDFHSTLLGQEMTALRQAEKHAKDNRLGLFKGMVANKGTASSDAEVVVTRIQTADTVYLRNKAGSEKRVSLSSIRQPKPTDPKQAPFQAEAKEFLRKKLIGKHAKVTVDGKKAASEGYEEREVVTIMANSKNVALMLVEAGFASVIRHRRDDGKFNAGNTVHTAYIVLDDRSLFYDELLAAEESAQKDEKGMWSSKPPTQKVYQDYSETLQKAKLQASVLQRQKKIPAVIDFVKSGSRFTVLVPRENAKLTFVLSGIRAPRSARNPQEKAEPFGQEAHDFANRRCNQRDVEIDVENTDKTGGFIGTLYINRENFAKVLVDEGLASVHAYSAEQSGNANELFAAEKKAKEARKGMWHDWDPSKEEDGEAHDEAITNGTNGTANGDSASGPPKKDYRDVVVTHVDKSCHLKFQLIGSGTSALTTLMSAFRTFHLSPSNSGGLPTAPKAGDIVAAKFSEDGEWYRARIRRNDREAKTSDVLFIDYGNSESLPWTSLRPLTQPQFAPQKLKAQAVDAQLSFLHFPTNPGWLSDAVDYLTDATAGKDFVASVDFTEKDGTLWCTLFDPEKGEDESKSLNAEIIGEGVATVSRKLKPWEARRTDLVKGLKAKEDEAQEGRKGMWEFADPTED